MTRPRSKPPLDSISPRTLRALSPILKTAMRATDGLRTWHVWDLRGSQKIHNIDIQASENGSATLSIPADGQVAMFLNQVRGLTVPRNLQGLVQLSTTSPAGMAVTGLRGRYNERGDFLITATPAVDETAEASIGSLSLPHVVDGGGYSTQLVLFSPMPGRSPTGTLRFYTPSGLPLEPSLR